MEKDSSRTPVNAADNGGSQESNENRRSSSSISEEATNSRIDDGNGKISNEMEGRISELFAKLEQAGPTVSRYQYDEASSEVKRLASEMKEKALISMVHHLRMEDAKILAKNQGGVELKPKNFSPKFLEVEIKLKELEKQSNGVTRRINEHKREQAHTLEKIRNLEARVLLDEKKDFIKDILTRIPTEADLQNLETIRLKMVERKRAESRIKLLTRRASALDRAMGSMAKSKWFRDNQAFQRRLGQLPPTDESILSNRDLISAINSEMTSMTSARDVINTQEILKKNLLPDFTTMPAAKRDAFLAKHFPPSSSLSPNPTISPQPKSGQDIGGSAYAENSVQDIGKSDENSGVTIVTLNSSSIVTGNEGNQQSSRENPQAEDGGLMNVTGRESSEFRDSSLNESDKNDRTTN